MAARRHQPRRGVRNRDIAALDEARTRWGDSAVVRHTRSSHVNVCEVGVLDSGFDGKPWDRPMVVLGSGASWIRAFANADDRARAQVVDAGASS